MQNDQPTSIERVQALMMNRSPDFAESVLEARAQREAPRDPDGQPVRISGLPSCSDVDGYVIVECDDTPRNFPLTSVLKAVGLKPLSVGEWLPGGRPPAPLVHNSAAQAAWNAGPRGASFELHEVADPVKFGSESMQLAATSEVESESDDNDFNGDYVVLGEGHTWFSMVYARDAFVGSLPFIIEAWLRRAPDEDSLKRYRAEHLNVESPVWFTFDDAQLKFTGSDGQADCGREGLDQAVSQVVRAYDALEASNGWSKPMACSKVNIAVREPNDGDVITTYAGCSDPIIGRTSVSLEVTFPNGPLTPDHIAVLRAMGVSEADLDAHEQEAKHQLETELGEIRNAQREVGESARQLSVLKAQLDALFVDAPRPGVKPAIAGLLTTAPENHRFGRFR